MNDRIAFGRICGLLLFGALLPGCLPENTHAVPGSLLTTMSGSPATQNGFSTEDGWAVSFDRVLVSAGPMQLDDEGCKKYGEWTEPGYGRVLDVVQPGAQKLSIIYGTGLCAGVDFEVSEPNKDFTVLGSGVSEADKTFMLTPGSDRYAPYAGVPFGGVTMHLEGAGVSGPRTLHFTWDIRQSLFYKDCSVLIDGNPEKGVDLKAGAPAVFDLMVSAEAFFRDDVQLETRKLRFAPFAEADARGNGDGFVALDELASVSLDELRQTAPYGIGHGGTSHAITTLEDYVYVVLFGRGTFGDEDNGIPEDPGFSHETFLGFRDTGTCKVGDTEP